MGSGDRWFFDRVAPVYDWFMFGADADAIWAGLEMADRPVRRVADVGGGTGRGLRAVSPAEGLVIDASRPMVERARNRNVAVALGDARRLPLADESVDAVTIIDALHHLPEPERALRDAVRVTRPGGVVVVREFDPSTIRGRAIELGEVGMGFDSTFLTPAEATDWLRGLGLDASVPDLGWSYTAAGVKRENRH